MNNLKSLQKSVKDLLYFLLHHAYRILLLGMFSLDQVRHVKCATLVCYERFQMMRTTTYRRQVPNVLSAGWHPKASQTRNSPQLLMSGASAF